MAEQAKEIIGRFDWNLNQFDPRTIALAFQFKDLETEQMVPWDLKQFSDIVIDVRLGPNVNKKLYYRFKLGQEISITGTDDEVLVIEVPAIFYKDAMQEVYHYDARFTYAVSGESKTVLEGRVNINLRITNPAL